MDLPEASWQAPELSFTDELSVCLFFKSNRFYWVNLCHKTVSTRKHGFAFWLHRYREDQLPVAVSKHMPSQREVIEPGERGRDVTTGPAEFLITPSSPCMYMLSLCFLLTVGPSYPLSLLSVSLATGYWLWVCCQLGWWAARPGGNWGSWQEHQLKAPRGQLLIPSTIQLCLHSTAIELEATLESPGTWLAKKLEVHPAIWVQLLSVWQEWTGRAIGSFRDRFKQLT